MTTLANKVQLIGHLGMDPEVKTFKTGKMLRIRIATNASHKDKSGEMVEDTHWHTLIAWNKTAELGEKLFRKGKQVAVEGTLVNRAYEDKEGVKRFVTEINLDKFLMLGRKED